MRPLEGQVALVTGASRGIGRGIAIQLADAGATVYITGRGPGASHSNTESGLPSLEKTAKDIQERGGEAIPIHCDHSDSEDVKKLFEKITEDTDGQLDILVNNAFSGVPAILQNAGRKFYECAPELWDEMNEVGLRNHYFCAVLSYSMD
ncbi:dehydrogenasesshort chain protein 9 [Aphelenchoides avenae]|nr:dehydrogenasesshort chain protein 9 [Aphelenchus avenae]